MNQRSIPQDIPIPKLVLRYAIPGITSGLVNALYNIVDQIFIGQAEGVLGNAATNVAFPLVCLCLSMSLLFGIGGASNYSLCLGRGDEKTAQKFMGVTLSSLVIAGFLFAFLAYVFLDSLLWICGATEENYQLAYDYTSITIFAIPFFMFAASVPQLVRAEGNPKKAMHYSLIGCGINLVLDPILIFGFDMGIKGAAIATAISQMISCFLFLWYFYKYSPVKKSELRPDLSIMAKVASLGLAPATNQFTLMITQIAMNNSLKHYGSASEYGSDIPLAIVGVVSKVNVLYTAIAVGLALGAQPIIGYHYGAKNYDLVKKCYVTNVVYVTIVSVFVFLSFQLLPRQILSFFGEGSELYFQFGIRYFRIFMALAFLNGINPITANFLTAIGKAKRGMILPFSKQMLFMLPLLLILPSFWGIEGILLVGPATDILAFLTAMYLITSEFKEIKRLVEV
ncbi:MAG: MATE family efflux transporter [Eubacteriales bacterium]